MSLGQLGPFTIALETLAAAVGAGILLGGFSIGVCRLMAGRPRRELDVHVLTDGYFGGGIGVVFVLLDLLLRYG